MVLGETDKKYFESAAIILAAFIGSVVARLVVISNAPSFLIGGDSPSYVAFSKEIIANGFLIPSYNSIHYPNSLWVVPPILPEFFAVLTFLAGSNTWNSFYALGIFGVILDSLIVFPLWKLTNLLFNRTSAIIAVFAFVFYIPDMDVIAWGGYPQIVGNFLVLWIFYYVILLAKADAFKAKYAVIIGILMSILALVHDLSSLFLFAALVFYLVARNSAYIIQGSRKKLDWTNFRKNSSYLFASIMLSVPAFAYWYIPRWSWVYDSIFHHSYSISQITAAALNSSISTGSALPGQSAQFILGIIAVPVFFAGLLGVIKTRMHDEGSFLLFSFIAFSLITTAITIGSSTISGRLVYFSFLPAFVVMSYGISTIIEKITEVIKRRPRRCISFDIKKVITVAVLAIVVSVNASVAVPSALSAHTYYVSSNDFSSNTSYLNSVEWMQQNVPTGSVIAAPGVYGSFIMGYTGNPVLVYRDSIYLTQPSEWNESLAAYVLIYEPSLNVSLTEHYISEYNVSIVCMYNAQAHNLPSFYNRIYSANAVSVYKI